MFLNLYTTVPVSFREKKKLNTFFKKAISKFVKALIFFWQKTFSLTFNIFQIFVNILFNIITNVFVDQSIVSINFQDFTSLHSYFSFSFYFKKFKYSVDVYNVEVLWQHD